MKGLYQKRGHYYFQPPTIKGKPRPNAFALDTTDEITAIQRAVRYENEGLQLRGESKDTLAEVLPRYYADKAESKKSTRRGRRLMLDAFMDVTGNPRVCDINRALILDWRETLKESGGTLTSTRGVGDVTLVTYLRILKAFLRWCIKQGLLREDPTAGFESKVVRTRRQNFLTISQREALLAEPCPDYLGLILHLGFFAGLRIGEMLACHKDWFFISADGLHASMTIAPVEVLFDNGSRGTWRPKSERGCRTIPLHDRLLAFIQDYGMREPWLLRPEQPIFPGELKASLRFDPKKALASHAKRCGIPNINYHMLRHSFGTHLVMAGMPIASVAGLLGNEVGVTERSYAGFSPANNHLLNGI